MLASTVLPATNIVMIMYGGPVRTEELLDAREEVDGVVRRCATARLLVEHRDRDPVRIEPKAMWADLTTAHLLRDVGRQGGRYRRHHDRRRGQGLRHRPA